MRRVTASELSDCNLQSVPPKLPVASDSRALPRCKEVGPEAWHQHSMRNVHLILFILTSPRVIAKSKSQNVITNHPVITKSNLPKKILEALEEHCVAQD